MKSQEGAFTLLIHPRQVREIPELWVATGFVYAAGEDAALEYVTSPSRYASKDLACDAALDATREVARGLSPDDSLVSRGRRP